MPLTPHDLGLHKLLKLFSPLVRPLLNTGATKRLRSAVNIADVRSCAEQRTHSMCFGYLDSGGDDEVSLRRNHDAYTQLEMHFKVMMKYETSDLSRSIFEYLTSICMHFKCVKISRIFSYFKGFSGSGASS